MKNTKNRYFSTPTIYLLIHLHLQFINCVFFPYLLHIAPVCKFWIHIPTSLLHLFNLLDIHCCVETIHFSELNGPWRTRKRRWMQKIWNDPERETHKTLSISLSNSKAIDQHACSCCRLSMLHMQRKLSYLSSTRWAPCGPQEAEVI